LKPLELVRLEFAHAAVAERVKQKGITTDEAGKIERRAEREIKSLINEVVGFAIANNLDVGNLQGRYANKVKSEIRAAVHDAYMTGAEYAGKVVGEKNVYPSTQNTRRIGEITDQVEEFFWSQVNLQIQAEGTRVHAQEVLTPDQMASFVGVSPLLTLYDKANSAGMVANMAVFPALAIGTFDKANELKPTNPLFALEKWEVVYVSMEDDRVCPQCEALDYRTSGIYYDFNDPNIPIPRYSTHPYCRCEWWLVIDGVIKYQI